MCRHHPLPRLYIVFLELMSMLLMTQFVHNQWVWRQVTVQPSGKTAQQQGSYYIKPWEEGPTLQWLYVTSQYLNFKWLGWHLILQQINFSDWFTVISEEDTCREARVHSVYHSHLEGSKVPQQPASTIPEMVTLSSLSASSIIWWLYEQKRVKDEHSLLTLSLKQIAFVLLTECRLWNLYWVCWYWPKLL